MLFSCKITHSILTSLERRGEDLSVFYETCDWPPEFLRDSSSWLEADKMEILLQALDRAYGQGTSAESLVIAAGHHCKDLRAWGVLDSVLRMVQTPKDLFAQPERLISYFITPAPPLGELKRAADSVSFVLPVSEDQFPFVTSYLRAAFEALPTYINKAMATVQWQSSRVLISWSEDQVSLFSETQNAELSLNPELVRNILMNLENSQKELEETKKLLLLRERELSEVRASQEPHLENRSRAVADVKSTSGSNDELISGLKRELLAPVAFVLNDMYRIGDYVARAQQLITLLVGQGRATPQVQEAMRRVDWKFVAEEMPRSLRQSVSSLQQFQETLRDLELLNSNAPVDRAELGFATSVRQPGDLNRVVGRAIDRVSPRAHRVQIHRELTLDRPVTMDEAQLERAVSSVLNEAVTASGSDGVIRVRTRVHRQPKGAARAQVEIIEGDGAQDLSLFSSAAGWLEAQDSVQEKEKRETAFPLAAKIVDLHEGSLSIAREQGRGSTIVIDLPLH